MKVFVGADHRGFDDKQKLVGWIRSEGWDVEDVGNSVYDKNDDYPIIAEKVAKSVVDNQGSLGILLCGSGVGASAAANKIDGIVAAIGLSKSQVKAGRHDDDMNILVLAADETDMDKKKALIKVFLCQEFGTKPRYIRRLKQVGKLEDEN